MRGKLIIEGGLSDVVCGAGGDESCTQALVVQQRLVHVGHLLLDIPVPDLPQDDCRDRPGCAAFESIRPLLFPGLQDGAAADQAERLAIMKVTCSPVPCPRIERIDALGQILGRGQGDLVEAVQVYNDIDGCVVRKQPAQDGQLLRLFIAVST